ncbi:30364_t:CDS:2 [Gigaspora margarita]|uniref:30364_t:CDS:1 n=1 Tax=Gigaspora margarita TaxID=4874 RepID=A0ABM8VXS3_GIGMA|nr:30364_t:CDS:2 [Gigaspora margarita]
MRLMQNIDWILRDPDELIENNNLSIELLPLKDQLMNTILNSS